jgi:hypothetical protein
MIPRWDGTKLVGDPDSPVWTVFPDTGEILIETLTEFNLRVAKQMELRRKESEARLAEEAELRRIWELSA